MHGFRRFSSFLSNVLGISVKQHTVLVLVGDERFFLNRTAGLFAPKSNIESLAVGLNEDKALFTIVVSGTEPVKQQFVHQLNKLVNVLKVEDLSKEPHVEHELMLIKLNWQVTCVFARRHYDIQSLAVGHSEKEGITHFIIVVPGTDKSISKLVQQLCKLADIVEVQDITNLPFAERELILIKVAAAARREVLNISSVFQAKAVDVSNHTITLELTGDLEKMVAVQRLLEPYGICKVARTRRVLHWSTGQVRIQNKSM